MSFLIVTKAKPETQQIQIVSLPITLTFLSFLDSHVFKEDNQAFVSSRIGKDPSLIMFSFKLFHLRQAPTKRRRLHDEEDKEERERDPLSAGRAHIIPAGTLLESTGRLKSSLGLVIRTTEDVLGVPARRDISSCIESILASGQGKDFRRLAHFISEKSRDSDIPDTAEIRRFSLIAAAATFLASPTFYASITDRLLAFLKLKTGDIKTQLDAVPPDVRASLQPFSFEHCHRKFSDPFPGPFVICEPGTGEFAAVFAELASSNEPIIVADVTRAINTMTGNSKISFAVTLSTMRFVVNPFLPQPRLLNPVECRSWTFPARVWVIENHTVTVRMLDSFDGFAQVFFLPDQNLVFASTAAVFKPAPIIFTSTIPRMGVLKSLVQKATRRLMAQTVISAIVRAIASPGGMREASGAISMWYRLPVLPVEDVCCTPALALLLLASFASRCGYIPTPMLQYSLLVYFGVLSGSTTFEPYTFAKAAVSDLGIQPIDELRCDGSTPARVVGELLLHRSTMAGMASDKAMMARVGRTLLQRDTIIDDETLFKTFAGDPTTLDPTRGLTFEDIAAVPAFHDMHIDPGMISSILASSAAVRILAQSIKVKIAGSLKAGSSTTEEHAVQQAIWVHESAFNNRCKTRHPDFAKLRPLYVAMAPILASLRQAYIDSRVRPAFEPVVKPPAVPVSATDLEVLPADSAGTNDLGFVLATAVQMNPVEHMYGTSKLLLFFNPIDSSFSIVKRPASVPTRSGGGEDVCHASTVIIPSAVLDAQFDGLDLTPYVSARPIPHVDWLADATDPPEAQLEKAFPDVDDVWDLVAELWAAYTAGARSGTLPFRWSWFGAAPADASSDMMVELSFRRFDAKDRRRVRVTLTPFKSFGRARMRERDAAHASAPLDIVVDAPAVPGSIRIPHGIVRVSFLLEAARRGVIPTSRFRDGHQAWSVTVDSTFRHIIASEPILPILTPDLAPIIDALTFSGVARAIHLLKTAIFAGSRIVVIPTPTRGMCFGADFPRHPADVDALVTLIFLASISTAVVFKTAFKLTVHPRAPSSVLASVLDFLKTLLFQRIRTPFFAPPVLVLNLDENNLEAQIGRITTALERGTRILHPHQWVTIRWLLAMWNVGRNGINANPMGSGKTLETLAALLAHDTPGQHLVLCPASAAAVWAAEARNIAIWGPDPPFEVLTFKKRDDVTRAQARLRAAPAKHRIVVVVYDHYKVLIRYLLGKMVWTTLICDECHHVRNTTQRTDAAAMTLYQRAVGLSGTPWQRTAEDLSNQAAVLSLPTFRLDQVQSMSPWQLTAWLRTIMVRRIRNYEGTVIKTRPIEVEMTPAEAEAYRLAVVKATADAERARQAGRNITTAVAGLFSSVAFATAKVDAFVEAIRTRLHFPEPVDAAQRAHYRRKWKEFVANKPALRAAIIAGTVEPFPDDWARVMAEENSKIEQPVEALNRDDIRWRLTDHSVYRHDERLLVFATSTSSADRLVEILNQRLGAGTAFRLVDADGVRDFQKGATCPPVAVAVLRSFSEGYTLTRAHVVILYERDWNPAPEEQGIHRVARYGQTDPVEVLSIVVKSTIQARQVKVVEARRAEMSYVQSAVTSGTATVASIMRDALEEEAAALVA